MERDKYRNRGRHNCARGPGKLPALAIVCATALLSVLQAIRSIKGEASSVPGAVAASLAVSSGPTNQQSERKQQPSPPTPTSPSEEPPSEEDTVVRQRLVLSDIHKELFDLPFPIQRNPVLGWVKPTGTREPEPYYGRPLLWPHEAVNALEAYVRPNLTHVLLDPPVPKFELVVNKTKFRLYPRGMLVVSDAVEYPHITSKYHQPFADDMARYIKQLPERYHTMKFATWVRDYHHSLPFPILTKARSIGDTNGILLPLKYKKHFFNYLQKLPSDTLPFDQKQFGVVWRGMDSGSLYSSNTRDPDFSRFQLVRRWSRFSNRNINIAFAGDRTFSSAEDAEKNARYWGPVVPIVEQRTYRYLVSAEGHDVATGLKWMLDSNSVVLMPPPRREIWSLEGQLKAWVHYVPVRHDYADLWDRMMLCEAHLDMCEAISRRATEFIAFYKDDERNERLAVMRVKEYLDNVQVTVVS